MPGSMVLFFFCRSFFAQQGEKRPTHDKNLMACVSPTIKASEYTAASFRPPAPRRPRPGARRRRAADSRGARPVRHSCAHAALLRSHPAAASRYSRAARRADLPPALPGRHGAGRSAAAARARPARVSRSNRRSRLIVVSPLIPALITRMVAGSCARRIST